MTTNDSIHLAVDVEERIEQVLNAALCKGVAGPGKAGLLRQPVLECASPL